MEDQITLNGTKYIREGLDVVKKPAKRFKAAIERKLLVEFNKMFSDEGENSIGEDYAVANGITVIDPANVALVSAKTEEAKRFLARFKGFESEDKKFPDLDLKSEKDETNHAKYSMEYIQKIINILDVTTDSIKLTMKTDMPITIEDEHFIFVLAPRIESDD